jgi:HPt (histidine-containing phosphotransfer) domain-containing protein
MLQIELFKESYEEFDQAIINEIINLFLEDYPEVLNSLEKAINNSDFQRLTQVAHKYKGTVSAMFDDELKELVQKLEQKGKQNTLEGAIELYDQIVIATNCLSVDLKKMLR